VTLGIQAKTVVAKSVQTNALATGCAKREQRVNAISGTLVTTAASELVCTTAQTTANAMMVCVRALLVGMGLAVRRRLVPMTVVVLESAEMAHVSVHQDGKAKIAQLAPSKRQLTAHSIALTNAQTIVPTLSPHPTSNPNNNKTSTHHHYCTVRQMQV
jgi:hypothetical protein